MPLMKILNVQNGCFEMFQTLDFLQIFSVFTTERSPACANIQH